MADFDVTIGADLGDLLSELRGMSDLTDKEFKKLTKGIERSFKGARSEARKLRLASESDIGKKGKQAFEAFKQAAEGVGGSIGGAVGAVEKFGRSIAEAGGAGGIAGVALGAAASGAVAYAFAVVKISEAWLEAVDRGRQWRDELVEIGMLQKGAGASLDAYQDTVDGTTASLKAMAVGALDEVAGGLEENARLGLLAAAAMRRVWEETDESERSWISWLNPFNVVNDTLGITAKATEALTDNFDGLEEEVDGIIESFKRKREEQDRDTDSIRRNTEAVVDQARVNREAAQAWLEQQAQAQAFTAEVSAMAAAEDAEAEARTQAAIARSSRELAADLDANRERLRSRMDLHHAIVNMETSLASSVESLARSSAQAIAENDKLSENQKRKRIGNAFAVQQGAANSRAVIEGAEAYMGMVAFFASFLGPGAPAAAALVVGPALAAQLAVINAQQPPTFPTGGRVGDMVDADHVMIGAQRDEGVLTARGMDAVGGSQGLAEINAGRHRGQPMVVKLELAPGVLAEAILADRPTQKAVLQLIRGGNRGRGV